jgi:hypothetical protein
MNISIKKALGGLLIVPLMAFAVSMTPVAVSARSIDDGINSTTAPGDRTCLVLEDGESCGDGSGNQTPLFQTIANVLLFIIGAISVIMLIIGGIRYTISNGDSGAITNAKNTILYAIIGVIVALLAFAIVNFVVGSF